MSPEPRDEEEATTLLPGKISSTASYAVLPRSPGAKADEQAEAKKRLADDVVINVQNGGGRTSESGAPKKAPVLGTERFLCRICMEEDFLSKLDAPFSCLSTLRHAHRAGLRSREEDMVSKLDAPCSFSGTLRHVHPACLRSWEEDMVSKLDAPCSCSGTLRHVHPACLRSWVRDTRSIRCEACSNAYSSDYVKSANADRNCVMQAGMYAHVFFAKLYLSLGKYILHVVAILLKAFSNCIKFVG
eukprot:gene24460-10060_t